jgi:hypothetical protein
MEAIRRQLAAQMILARNRPLGEQVANCGVTLLFHRFQTPLPSISVLKLVPPMHFSDA